MHADGASIQDKIKGPLLSNCAVWQPERWPGDLDAVAVELALDVQAEPENCCRRWWNSRAGATRMSTLRLQLLRIGDVVRAGCAIIDRAERQWLSGHA